MKGFLAGLGLLLVLGVGGYLVYSQVTAKKVVELKGVIGSEKAPFLQNAKVKAILKDKYGFVLRTSTSGSLEMVRSEPAADTAFLWPSSQIPLEIFKAQHTGKLVKAELIFSSPIVFYSWDRVEAALLARKLLVQEGAVTYMPDLPAFFGLCQAGKKWADVGLPELFGKISLVSTDPVKSNSGMMFAGLLAVSLAGDVPDDQTVGKILPSVGQYFGRLGFLQGSSGILFEQYLKTGVGQYPLIAGYENQMVEFALANPELWQKVKGKLRVIYPAPTVWSEHPLLILNSQALGLIDALKDPEIQRIAWEEHGFRTGLAGLENNPKILGEVGIPETVVKTVPMPRSSVMEKILQTLNPESP